MGRQPTRNKNLPTGMRARHRGAVTYYYFDTGDKPRKEIALGTDYVQAVAKWSELSASNRRVGELVTFRVVAERYVREVLPTKEPATRELNLRELGNLYAFFDDPSEPMDSIEPVMVRQYLDWRVKKTVAAKREKNAQLVEAGKAPVAVSGKEGQIPANREKALFSHIWNFAREKGLTTKPNPCAGIKGFTEKGRDVYVDDDVFDAVYAYADPRLQDALDLAYLLGQRPADVLKLSRSDIKDGAISVVQNKTGKRVRIEVEGRLAEVVARINARKVMGLRLVNLTRAELRGAFDRARDAAAAAHPHLERAIRQYQFRDLRAKAGTDTEQTRGMEAAQAQLGHTTANMTRHYVRNRLGKLVKPTK